MIITVLLRGRPIGRVTRRARPFVRPSVRLSVPYGLVTRKHKKTRKFPAYSWVLSLWLAVSWAPRVHAHEFKIGVDVPQGTSKWTANF